MTPMEIKINWSHLSTNHSHLSPAWIYSQDTSLNRKEWARSFPSTNRLASLLVLLSHQAWSNLWFKRIILIRSNSYQGRGKRGLSFQTSIDSLSYKSTIQVNSHERRKINEKSGLRAAWHRLQSPAQHSKSAITFNIIKKIKRMSYGFLSTNLSTSLSLSFSTYSMMRC